MKATYIIGEIGQNHNGSLDLAKKLIDVAALPIVDMKGRTWAGVNAIKLQKRDLSQELAASEMAKPYDSAHSFGATYGEHRAALELSDEEHFALYQYTKAKGLDFVETVCSPGALSILKFFRPDRLKVASRDVTNLPLLEAIAETEIPIILSTGMAGLEELEAALDIITKYHDHISILHCLSQYPAEHENLNLNTIRYLLKHYPQYTIGYSDHSIGVIVPVVAVAMGARVIEKHITLSRGMKGSDHAGSLGPDGLLRMVRDIRHIEASLGTMTISAHPAVEPSRRKLERSIAAKRDLVAGEVITEADIYLLSPGTGLRWSQRNLVIGRRLTQAVKKDELIVNEYLEQIINIQV
jgi:sialic acid synthase SpsE